MTKEQQAHVALAIQALQRLKADEPENPVLTEHGVRWQRMDAPEVDTAIDYLLEIKEERGVTP